MQDAWLRGAGMSFGFKDSEFRSWLPCLLWANSLTSLNLLASYRKRDINADSMRLGEVIKERMQVFKNLANDMVLMFLGLSSYQKLGVVLWMSPTWEECKLRINYFKLFSSFTDSNK